MNGVAVSRQEHTRSYYAASINSDETYPTLTGDVEADVCIVGAGFTGVATALTLAERGFKVALVEANRVGWGASGRNGGQLINGLGGLSRIERRRPELADLLWDIRWRGNDIIRERVERYAIDCDLKDGYVEVARKPSQVAYTHEAAEELEKRNFPHRFEVWDRQQTSERLGTQAFHGAFASYRDGHVHPLNLCRGEARVVAERGGAIYEQSPVTRIEHGARPKVITERGSVTADSVVLAGNAYQRLEGKHLANLVFPAGSYIIATEPLSEAQVNDINPLDVAVCDLNDIVDYYRLSADRRMLFGGACNYSGRDPSSIKAYIHPRMTRLYPQLKKMKIEYEWGGKIGIVLNRVPVVGRINNNVYYCLGYSGHGVCGTHVMGEVMADAVGGTMERFDVFDQVQHFRLPGSRWLGNQIIALGMLYYRLKDLL
ncbi:MAG: FAD-binding oxidoreductase [Pseudomonadota bacterium]